MLADVPLSQMLKHLDYLIEIHLQGLSFNAIECDEIGSAHVSFVPIKPGDYELYIGNVPSALGRPMGEAGMQENGKFVLGKFKVQ